MSVSFGLLYLFILFVNHTAHGAAYHVCYTNLVTCIAIYLYYINTGSHRIVQISTGI